MWFRKIIFGALALGFGLAALAFCLLFIVCLSLFILWHGLSAGVIMFGALTAVCVIMAYKALKRTSGRGKTRVLS